VRHRFVNDRSDPLQVTYQLPLPADAAVGGYTFSVGDRRIVGEVDRRESARQRFEDAVLEGQSAALLEQDRSAIFTQEIGNIPARAEVESEIVLDQRLRWLEDGQWEWRFPTIVAPRYLGAEGRVDDAKRVAVDVSESGLPVRATLMMRVLDGLTGGSPTSPTHRIVSRSADRALEVSLADEAGVALDRDIAVRWSVAAAEPGVTMDLYRPPGRSAMGNCAFGLLTVTPPALLAPPRGRARDLIVLFDTSGSMSGAPLKAAKEVVLAIISALRPTDRLELIEFSNTPRLWQEHPAAADDKCRAAAAAWVKSLGAGGGTEMQTGLRAALKPLRPDAPRQVVLVTDGLVGFEKEVIGLVRRATPKGCRVHVVGIGSAPNRSLTAALARAGGGGEFIIGLDEPAQEAAARVVARVSTPLIENIRVRGDALLESANVVPPDLMSGAPTMLPLRLRPQGGTLTLEGVTNEEPWIRTVIVPPVEPGAGSAAAARVFGREKVEELEMKAAAGAEVDRKIERTGLDFQIATRMTSWIAVSEEPTVDPREAVRRERIPQSLPYGLSSEGLGLRRSAMPDMSSVGLSLACARFCRPGSDERDIVSYMRKEDVWQETENASDPATKPSAGLIGRLVSCGEGRVVIEIELDADLEWSPESVRFRDARIDIKSTTKPGTYFDGQVLRLVIVGIRPQSMPSAGSEVVVRQTGPVRRLKIRIASA